MKSQQKYYDKINFWKFFAVILAIFLFTVLCFTSYYSGNSRKLNSQLSECQDKKGEYIFEFDCGFGYEYWGFGDYNNYITQLNILKNVGCEVTE